ncbi:MAG: hypothetical protein EXR69_08905 [Myxococcales bacterium]|nr:hypothetical protein [Myxococcales bacterium]
MQLAIMADIASAFAVGVAVLFGSLQIREMGKTRALFTSTDLGHAMLTAEFTRSVRDVMQLPDHADPLLVSEDPEVGAAVLSLSHVFECLGVLVFHRIVSLHLVDDLMGGYVRQSWRRVRPHVEVRRKEMGVSYGEWMQWLAERLDEHPSPGKSDGAYAAHRKWRP